MTVKTRFAPSPTGVLHIGGARTALFSCDFADFTQKNPGIRLFACTTKAAQFHPRPSYQSGDGFLFGPETRGLPENLLKSLPQEQKIRVPMQPHSRSLNLSNAVAVVLYEALRQSDFKGLG